MLTGLVLMVRSQILQSFVARIWLERTDEEEPKWRGHIQHIQGNEDTYFRDLTEMSDFIQQVSGFSGLEISVDQENVVKMPDLSVLANRKPKRGKSDD